MFKCIERIILNTAAYNYVQLDKPEELRYLEIGNGIIIDLELLFQFRIEDTNKQR